MSTLRTILAGDIGATKSLEAILGKFTPPGQAVLDRACFGVAGPVEHGIAHLTNLPWVVDKQALAAALRTPSISVINDLQAAAYGMLFVDPTQFAVLHAGPGAPHHATLAVIAPCTGLGEALLFWDGERYHAVASEGGHADFAPETDQEIELLRCLRQRFGHVGGLIARFTDKGRFSAWVGKLDLRVALDPRAPLLGAANWTIAPPEHMVAS